MAGYNLSNLQTQLQMKGDKLAAILASRFVEDASGGKARAKLQYTSISHVYKVTKTTVRDASKAFKKGKRAYIKVYDL